MNPFKNHIESVVLAGSAVYSRVGQNRQHTKSFHEGIRTQKGG